MPSEKAPAAVDGFMSGLGQAIPLVLLSGIGALLTLTVNVQVQLAEVRKDQQALMAMVEERKTDMINLERVVRDIDRRVTTLEAR